MSGKVNRRGRGLHTRPTRCFLTPLLIMRFNAPPRSITSQTADTMHCFNVINCYHHFVGGANKMLGNDYWNSPGYVFPYCCWSPCPSGYYPVESSTPSSSSMDSSSRFIYPSVGSEKTMASIKGKKPSRWDFPCVPPPAPLPGWFELPYNLELYWMNGFLWLFMDLYLSGHLWTLQPVEKPPKDDHRGLSTWRPLIHTAKVRFSCEDCKQGWTSMYGKVVFWFRLCRPGPSVTSPIRGEVVFKLYKQKCTRCESSTKFQTAMWYGEEILNALWNLHLKIGETFYGWPSSPTLSKGIRQGKPLRPHKPEFCEACRDGICRQGERTKESN